MTSRARRLWHTNRDDHLASGGESPTQTTQPNAEDDWHDRSTDEEAEADTPLDPQMNVDDQTEHLSDAEAEDAQAEEA